MKKTLLLSSELETDHLGNRIARAFQSGGCVALYGDLGCGKSVIARGMASFLGIDHISSPTFTVLQSYDTVPHFYHIDAYRLSSCDELLDIGFDDCLKEKALIAVEWADIVEAVLPDNRLNIYLSGSGMEKRQALIEMSGNCMAEEDFNSL